MSEKEEIKELLFSDIQDDLKEPFPASDISWKPQATNKEKTSALAAAFAEPRVYEDRLNVLCPNDWHCEVELSQYVKFVQVPKYGSDEMVWKAIGYVQAVARVTICGITRSSTGEEMASDKNAATCAEAQAFKRACSKFGLGRFLYSIKTQWADIVNGRFTPEAIQKLTRGLPSSGSAAPPPDSTAPEPSNAPEKAQEQAPGRTCSECGTTITRDEWDYSDKQFKKPLCRNCQPKKANPNKPISPKQINYIHGLCENKDFTEDELAQQQYGHVLSACNSAQASEMIDGIQNGTMTMQSAPSQKPSAEDQAEADKFVDEIDLDDDDPFKEEF